MIDTPNIISRISEGFTELKVDQKYKEASLKNIEKWLVEEEFKEFVPEIKSLIEKEDWDGLLDSFYQVIPFGTGGRRGLMGPGPNRINVWTIESSAQGHSQYLIEKFGEAAKGRGVVVTYDVRKNCEEYARKAACVYAANGLKVFISPSFCSIAELSFAVRYKNAVGGCMISASHNPPAFNGKKVVDSTGGQLIPPDDQELVSMVAGNVKGILRTTYKSGLISELGDVEHEAFINAAKQSSVSGYRGAKILYSPFHGTGTKSVFEVLMVLNFDVSLDPVSGVPDPNFSSIVFNIPSPEVEEAYKNLIPYADGISADIILASDPDADRIGLMSRESAGWKFFNGNEIFVLCLSYLLEELSKKDKLMSTGVVVKTLVTTNLASVICEKYNVQVIPDLLVGIKYVADEMNKLDKEGRMGDFLIGGEESHGLVMGDYIRDKDASVPAVLLSELASRLKGEDETLGSYLDKIYERFGYFRNYLTEIKLPGAEGMASISRIQESLRNNIPTSFGDFEILEFKDMWDGESFSSESDKVSRNVLIFRLKPIDELTQSVQVTVRPSGTEAKTKIYIEIGNGPLVNRSLDEEKRRVEVMREKIEKAVFNYCCRIIGIEFPNRGFLLFWQLPIMDKMKYFEVEPDIEALKNIDNKVEREEELSRILEFLGSNPLERVNKAFIEKNGVGIKEFLGLT